MVQVIGILRPAIDGAPVTRFSVVQSLTPPERNQSNEAAENPHTDASDITTLALTGVATWRFVRQS